MEFPGANTMKNWQHPIQQAIQNTNAAVRYPDYYQVPFHAYEQESVLQHLRQNRRLMRWHYESGKMNLTWQAALSNFHPDAAVRFSTSVAQFHSTSAPPIPSSIQICHRTSDHGYFTSWAFLPGNDWDRKFLILSTSLWTSGDHR